MAMVGRSLAKMLMSSCRFLCRPILPMLPDSLANRMPFLGRVCVHGPDDLKLRFHTYGPYGKDRIALKLARRGFLGYEGETIRLFLPLVRQAQTVIDVGANTGLFALLAAKANPACRVWAFEPVPFIFDMLERNIRLNGLTNLQAVAAAVADATGETSFFVTHTRVGIPTDSSSCAGFRSQVEEVRLPTITLDEFVERANLPPIDVLKIDAETTESQVIRGAVNMLREHRPLVICEVLADVDHDYLQQTFENLDYQFFHIGPTCLEQHPRLRGSVAVDERNYVFVPAEKQAMLVKTCQDAEIPMILCSGFRGSPSRAMPSRAMPSRAIQGKDADER